MRAHAEERSRDAHVCGADCRIHARRVRQAHMCGPGCSHGASVARIASTGPVSAGFFASDDFAPAPSTGRSLPDGPVARSLGALAAGVRVHEGVGGLGRATAVTEGTDIMLAPSAPAPGTAGGDLLLAHEAAHVRQQAAGARGGPTVSRERAEQLADDAAVATLAGAPVREVGAFTGEQAFEAPLHQATLTEAMQRQGFTDAESQQAYFANWCRDVSQAFIPLGEKILGPSLTMGVLNVLSIQHFGHGVTPAQMQAYDTRHHIDNPAGTTDRDVMQGGNAGRAAGAEIRLPGFEGDDAVLVKEGENADHLKPENIADQFKVSAAGVPAYIDRSKGYIVEELNAAAEKGRTDKGLFHMGNASHTLEDLFAHSNWVEAAVGRLISENAIQLSTGAAKEVGDRKKAGLPPIENFAPDIKDDAGNVRPVLQTGTFSGGTEGHDTIISLKEELKNILMKSPFAEKADTNGQLKWDVTLEVLEAMDAAVEGGQGGEVVATILEDVGANLTKLIEDAAAGAGNDKHDPREQFDEKTGQPKKRGVWDSIKEGASELVGKGVGVVKGVASDAWKSVLRDAVEGFVNRFGSAGLKLTMLAVYVEKGETWIAEAWKDLKDKAASALPAFLRELVIPKIVAAEKAFKEQIRKTLDAAWQTGAKWLVGQFEGMTKKTDKAESNVDVKFEKLKEDLRLLKIKAERVIRELAPKDQAEEVIAQLNATPLEGLVAFIESGAFHELVTALGERSAEAGARLTAMGEEITGSAHTAHQLSNVPEWARAGASHSQTAKDHQGDPFFAPAFMLANHVDGEITGLMMSIWTEQSGSSAPAEGFEEDIETKTTEAGKEEIVDEGLNEAEKARRRAFLERRKTGASIVATGRPTIPHAGEEAVKAAILIDGVLKAYSEELPVVGPMLGQLTDLLRDQAEAPAIQAQIKKIRAGLESGEYEDRVVDAVNRGLEAASRAAGLLARADHGHGEKADPCPHEETQPAHDQQACPHGHGDAKLPGADEACDNKDLPQHDQVLCTNKHGNETDKPAVTNPCEHDYPLSSPQHDAKKCPHPGDDEHTHQGVDMDHPAESNDLIFDEEGKPKLGPDGKPLRRHDEGRSEDFYHSQIDTLNKYRGKGDEMVRGEDGKLYTKAEAAKLGIKTASVNKAKDLDSKDAEIPADGDPKARIQVAVDRYFGHPYDSTWWVPSLTAWCNANQPLLEAYIKRRNQGKGHSHNHPH